MRVAKELIGKPIFSISDGTHLGSVKDLYLDPELKFMKGVFLGQEGLFNRKSRLVARESIAVVGLDAILTKDAFAVTDDRELTAAEGWLRRETLQGRQIDTPGGTKVGTIGDILLDEDGEIVGFTLARVYVEGPLADSRMVLQSAIVEHGGLEGIMKVDLSKAEKFAGETGEAATDVDEPVATPAVEEEEPAVDNSDEPEE